ncbi:hypothetical protein ACFXKC_43355 [Streptomyces sp. NPDC059340]|uniref:hypothetical protein n=1 Tax=Streptomyces sp. NPDC059340 TaxID=3346806 RepID=UPI003688C43E
MAGRHGPGSRFLESHAASKAEVLVLSAVTGQDGYDSRPELDADGWRLLLSNLDRLASLAAERGVRAVLHPHVGARACTARWARETWMSRPSSPTSAHAATTAGTSWNRTPS